MIDMEWLDTIAQKAAFAVQTPGTDINIDVPDSWADRITEVSQLEDGWLEPGSPKPSMKAIAAALIILAALAEKDSTDRPGIFPMPDGGVQLEWADTTQVTSVEIDNDGTAGSYQVMA